jgi:hypothetical protein
LTGNTTNCECGRPLQAGEVRCPSCERANQSWWKQAGAIVVSVGVPVAMIVLAIVTGGKVKPKV